MDKGSKNVDQLGVKLPSGQLRPDRPDPGSDEWWKAQGQFPIPAQSSPVFSKGVLPDDSGERKSLPVGTGCLDYFPNALAEVARISKEGNDKHNPGEPLHWARGKSGDHADTIIRHFMERGTRDSDGARHSAKLAWRALALLQEEIEADGWPMSRGSWAKEASK